VSHAATSRQAGPNYQELWRQLKGKVMAGADVVTEAATTETDARKSALLIGFGLALAGVLRAMEDGEMFGSVDDALDGAAIE
jgi:hypothetical protein